MANQIRPISPTDRWIVSEDGNVVGVQTSTSTDKGSSLFADAVPGDGILGRSVVLTPPAGLGWVPPIGVYRVGVGQYSTTYSAQAWQPITTAVLWVSPSGNDTTGTGTKAAPFRSIKKALQSMTAATTIYVLPGVYNRNNGWAAAFPAYDCSVIAYGGRVVSSMRWEGGTWTLTTAGTYSASRSAVYDVLDEKFPQDDGLAQRLTKYTTQAQVEASEGGGWATNGTTVWVKTADQRAPDAQTVALMNVPNGYMEQPVHLYVQGVVFEGSQSHAFGCTSTALTASTVLVLDGCELNFAAQNGLACPGLQTQILHRCSASRNCDDGFNYHEGSNGITPNAVEIDCVGTGNGQAVDATHNNNLSTAHEACRVLRVRTVGGMGYGPTFADIQTSKTWNVGCIDTGSLATVSEATQAVGFQVFETAVQYLDECASYSATPQYAAATAGQFVRNSPGIAGTAY